MSERLLKQVKRWQKAIATYWSQDDKAIALPDRYHLTQRLIVSLLGLRLCQQHQLLASGQWLRLQQRSEIYSQFQQLVQMVNLRYGSLFPQDLPEGLTLPDRLMLQILISLETHWTDAIGIEILGQAYERCLSQLATSSPSEDIRPTQKTGGSYYTPQAIVDDIIHSTLTPSLAHLCPHQIPHQITVLDPACGGGALLLAAYQYLLQAAGAPLPYDQRKALLLDCIFGVDIDAQAIAVTKLALGLQLLIGEAGSDTPPLPDLDRNIQCGNALMNVAWHQAFPPMAAGGFDVVIGNPPYIDSEWMTAMLPDWRHYCAEHYQTAVGNWDLFCVFIEKGLELCKPQGRMSFVVPNKLASAAYAAQARSLLTQTNQLLAIHDYSRLPMFSAAIYPLVFVVQKGVSHPNSSVQYALMGMAEQCTSQPIPMAVQQTYAVNYAAYSCPPGDPWLIPTLSSSLEWLSQLQKKFPPLAEIAQVTGAATVAEAYAMRSLLQNKPVLEPEDLQLVNSGTIDRYRILWGEKPLRYLGQSYWHPVIERSQTNQLPPTRRQQASQPKIIVAGMTRGLECALDATGGILAGKSTSVIRSGVDLRYLLGVLNSSLIRLFFVSYFGGNRFQGGYLRVGPPQLKQLPIRPPDWQTFGDRHEFESLYQQLIAQVDQCLLAQGRSPKQDPIIDQQINHLVYSLYGLTEVEMARVEEWLMLSGF